MPVPEYEMSELPFPFKGLHESSAIAEQPAGTTPLAVNVRGYDLLARRDRGCQRSGLAKWVNDHNGASAIDAIVVAALSVVRAGLVNWTVTASSTGGGAGTGTDFTANAGLKLRRHGALTLVTVSAAAVAAGNTVAPPGALTAANSTSSGFHPQNASPNPHVDGSGAFTYTLGNTAIDDNGLLGNGTLPRTLTLTGTGFPNLTFKQAGEFSFVENFAYANGVPEATSGGNWTNQTNSTTTATMWALSPLSSQSLITNMTTVAHNFTTSMATPAVPKFASSELVYPNGPDLTAAGGDWSSNAWVYETRWIAGFAPTYSAGDYKVTITVDLHDFAFVTTASGGRNTRCFMRFSVPGAPTNFVQVSWFVDTNTWHVDYYNGLAFSKTHTLATPPTGDGNVNIYLTRATNGATLLTFNSEDCFQGFTNSDLPGAFGIRVGMAHLSDTGVVELRWPFSIKQIQVIGDQNPATL